METQRITCEAAVIGAGAAGLNAMDELLARGIDAVLFADDLSGGASINSGSDKQTYYKLSLAGDAPDSVQAMAMRFFEGGGMQGCHARAMAALSAHSFMKLALLGVPFPQNEWGEYVGYRTDHDETLRATSAGPLTSRMMADCLRKSVKARGGRMYGGARLAAIYVQDSTACGALFEAADRYIEVNCGSIVLATGGNADIYGRSVFPANQHGATGVALRAGAKANNLCYWQYGLASTKVRWNVSGSYQQAIPEYVDQNGMPIAPDMARRNDMIFLKGYQWPFDAGRANASAAVDRAVKAVCDAGGHAYMDFTRDPLTGGFEGLSEETRSYLANCGALVGGAYERLVRINTPAAEFYRDRGIDLSREPLEIALCAQHSNGGLWVDEHWQTNVKNLYAVGECSGVFGAYRPGGSALNETQVGSLRAAERIAALRPVAVPLPENAFDAEKKWLENGTEDAEEMQTFRRRMDVCAGAVRSVDGMRALKWEVVKRLETLSGDAPLRDMLWVQKYALSAMLEQAKYSGSAGHMVEGGGPTLGDHRRYAFVTDENGTRAEEVAAVPEGDQWFESVWKKFKEERR